MDNNTIIIVIAVVLIGFGVLRMKLFGSAGIASTERLQQLMEDGALVVDVRTPEEFRAGHVEGAVNIPLDEIVNRSQELGDGEQPVILYCNSGNRSGQAIVRLHRHGLGNLTNGGGQHHMPS
ncbi:MAG TPA: rhodanese-like domain-containing protein [Alkalispirochaeta sp.]|nr:rhodanese-like domain-containing protein [Alkalispirochaeta sp.]